MSSVLNYPPDDAPECPWREAEIAYEARELYLHDFWKSQEWFYEVFSACPSVEQAILVHLFDAMRFLDDEEKSRACLALARAGVSELAAEIIPKDYYRMAANGETT
jgi:hypothetical protein